MTDTPAAPLDVQAIQRAIWEAHDNVKTLASQAVALSFAERPTLCMIALDVAEHTDSAGAALAGPDWAQSALSGISPFAKAMMPAQRHGALHFLYLADAYVRGAAYTVTAVSDPDTRNALAPFVTRAMEGIHRAIRELGETPGGGVVGVVDA